MKMHLASTDYGNFMQNEPSVTTTVLAARATVRVPTHAAHAVPPLCAGCPPAAARALLCSTQVCCC
jgi:hypothetical protein